MKSVKSCTALAVALLLAAPMVSFAQEAEAPAAEEEESPISWSVAATSDYTFRGVSQTDEGPALQAGITYSAPMGFYVGAWASNVDFGDGGPDVELDTYIGYNTDLGDEFVNLDIMLNRYNYLGGNGSDLSYNELITKLTLGGHVSFTVGYTNDVWASDENGWYYAVGGSVDLPWDMGLSAGIGRSTFDGGVARDYTDYSVTLSKSWGDFSVGLGYVGTDNDGDINFGELSDDRAVLTVTYAP